MKRDARTGGHYIVEPNVGRPTGRSAAAEAAGVELLYAMYCDVLGLPLPEGRLAQRYSGVKWIYFGRDIRSAFYYWRRDELSFAEWVSSLRGTEGRRGVLVARSDAVLVRRLAGVGIHPPVELGDAPR